MSGSQKNIHVLPPFIINMSIDQDKAEMFLCYNLLRNLVPLDKVSQSDYNNILIFYKYVP